MQRQSKHDRAMTALALKWANLDLVRATAENDAGKIADAKRRVAHLASVVAREA